MAKPGVALYPTRYLFFTGKGGVGKTSLSCAVALLLADRGRRVLLVSTDPASNLDEMLGVRLSDRPIAVPGAPNLSALNIDPDKAAEDYRSSVIDQMGTEATEDDRATVREQLSGACTIEIAAFDEFVDLLAGEADVHPTYVRRGQCGRVAFRLPPSCRDAYRCTGTGHRATRTSCVLRGSD